MDFYKRQHHQFNALKKMRLDFSHTYIAPVYAPYTSMKKVVHAKI